jgi:hypothetical protein
MSEPRSSDRLDRRDDRQDDAPLRSVDGRLGDIEPTKALRSVATLFRVLAGLLMVLMAAQVSMGLTSTVEISPGVLLGEAIRLVIFAALLWAAGDLANLYVKSQADTRATRILLARLTAIASRMETALPSGPAATPPNDRLRDGHLE